MERNFKNNSNLRWASTNNVLIKKNIINKENPSFDDEIQKIGGEDQLFFWLLRNKGYKIGWNSKSKVFDKSEKNRINFMWFLKRSFGYGCSADHINKKIFLIKKKLIKEIKAIRNGM